jgi:hypothetical protein
MQKYNKGGGVKRDGGVAPLYTGFT